jgi:hypothetical protein
VWNGQTGAPVIPSEDDRSRSKRSPQSRDRARRISRTPGKEFYSELKPKPPKNQAAKKFEKIKDKKIKDKKTFAPATPRRRTQPRHSSGCCHQTDVVIPSGRCHSERMLSFRADVVIPSGCCHSSARFVIPSEARNLLSARSTTNVKE